MNDETNTNGLIDESVKGKLLGHRVDDGNKGVGDFSPSFGLKYDDEGKLVYEPDSFTGDTRASLKNNIKASAELLFRTDIYKLDNENARALARSVSKGVLGIPDEGDLWFGKRKSADPVQNLEMMRDTLAGKSKEIYDPRYEAYMKADRTERLRMAREDERFMDGFKRAFSYGDGDEKSGWWKFAALSKNLVKHSLGLPISVDDALAVTEKATTEEKKASEDVLLKNYENELMKNQPLIALLSAKDALSDRAGWALTKAVLDGKLNADDLATLDKDERNAVIAGYGVINGTKKSVEILGIDTDISTGTPGDRVQMMLYGAQQAFTGLFTDSIQLGADLTDWVRLKLIKDRQEREEVAEMWSLVSRVREANKGELPKGGFFGEAGQVLAENWHWWIPYGGIQKAKGARKSVVEMGKKAKRVMEKIDKSFGEKLMGSESRDALALISEKYANNVERIKRVEKGLGKVRTALSTEIASLYTVTMASFAEEFLKTADAAGVSREESVPIAIAVGFVNDKIEKLSIPGLDENLTIPQLRSIGFKALMRSLNPKTGSIGRYVKNRLSLTIPAGAKVAVIEGAVEEPLQQIVIEHGIVAANDLKGIYNKEGKELSEAGCRLVADQLNMLLAKDIKTYVDTVIDMAPAAFGYLVTTGSREQARSLRQKGSTAIWRLLHGRKISAEKIDREGIAYYWEERRRLISATSKYLGEKAADEEKAKEEAEAESKAESSVETEAESKAAAVSKAEAESGTGTDEAGEKLPTRVNADGSIDISLNGSELPSPEFDASRSVATINQEVDNLIENAREIYKKYGSGGLSVGAMANELGMPTALAELANDFFADEDLFMMTGDPFYKAISKSGGFADVSEEAFAPFNVVENSYKHDSKRGITSVTIRLPSDAKHQQKGDGTVTLVFRMSDSPFLKEDGTVNWSYLGQSLGDDSYLGSSFNRRQKNYGEKKMWKDLSLVERKIFAVQFANGMSGESGTVELTDDKTGNTTIVNADSIIYLATGNIQALARKILPDDIADEIKTGNRSTQWTVYHETFHGLWKVMSAAYSDEEKIELAKSLGFKEFGKDWEEELNEAMAHQFEQYAAGQYVPSNVSSAFERGQAAVASFIEGMGIGKAAPPVQVVYVRNGVDFREFTLDGFYKSVIEGRVGSGNLGVPHVSTVKSASGEAKTKGSEIPVEVSEADREKSEAEAKAESRAEAGVEEESEVETESEVGKNESGSSSVRKGTSFGVSERKKDGTLNPNGLEAGKKSFEDAVTNTGGDIGRILEEIGGAKSEADALSIAGKFKPSLRSAYPYILSEWAKRNGRKTSTARRVAGGWDYNDIILQELPDEKGGGCAIYTLEVVNADDIMTSMKSWFDAPYLQHRDVTTTDSKSVVEKISAGPKQTKGGIVNPNVAGNTILIDSENRAIRGHHTSQGIIEGYNKGTAVSYRADTLEEAESRGLDISDRAYEKPVIVARLVGFIDNDTFTIEDLARLGNETEIRGKSKAAAAAENARTLRDLGVIGGISIYKNGKINTEESLSALQAFFRATKTQNALREVSTKDGLGRRTVLTKEGNEAIGNAILAYLFESEDRSDALLESLFDRDEELDISNEKKALVSVVTSILGLAEENPRYDIREHIRNAVSNYVNWRSIDEAERIEKGKSAEAWLKNTMSRWNAYNSQEGLALGSANSTDNDKTASLIATRLAESRPMRLGKKGEETQAGIESSIRYITDYFDKFVERAKAVNTETDDIFGSAPATAEEILKLKFSTGDFSGLFHGSAADWLRPDLEFIGSGQGLDVQGRGINLTTDFDMAGVWSRAAGRAFRPRTAMERIGRLLFGASSYIYEGSLKGARIEPYYGDALEAEAAKLVQSVDEEGYVYDTGWFDNPKHTRDVRGLERFLQFGVRDKRGERLTPSVAASLMVKAGIDGSIADQGDGLEKTFLIYNTDKYTVDHKWKNGKQLFSVGALPTIDAAKIEELVGKYGTTDEIRKAIYMLPDGRLLRGGAREYDAGNNRKGVTFGHDYVRLDIANSIKDRNRLKKLEEKGVSNNYLGELYDAANRAILKAKFIRIKDREGIEVSSRPTDQQFDSLWDAFEKLSEDILLSGEDTLLVDFTDENGGGMFYVEYNARTSPRRIIGDIRAWFDNGEIPDGARGGMVELLKNAAREGLKNRVMFSTVSLPTYVDDGALLIDLKEKNPVRSYSSMSNAHGEEDRRVAKKDAIRRLMVGVAIGQNYPEKRRAFIKDGDPFIWLPALDGMDAPDGYHLSEYFEDASDSHLGSLTYHQMRRVADVKEVRDEYGNGASYSELVTPSVKRSDIIPLNKLTREKVLEIVNSGDDGDPNRLHALYHAGAGRVSGLSKEESEAAAELFVSHFAERVLSLGRLMKKEDISSIEANPEEGEISQAIARLISKELMIPIGRTDATGIVAFAAEAGGSFVELMKDFALKRNAIAGIYAVSHIGNRSPSFTLNDLRATSDGFELVGSVGDAHRALLKLAHLANTQWGSDAFNEEKGYQALLNLLARFPRKVLDGRTGAELLLLASHFEGLDGIVEKISEEARRTSVSRNGHAAQRPFPLTNEWVNPGNKGKVATATSLSELDANKRLMMSTDGFLEVNDFEILTRHAKSVPFSEYRQSFERVVSANLDSFAEKIDALIPKNQGRVTIVIPIDETDDSTEDVLKDTIRGVIFRLRAKHPTFQMSVVKAAYTRDAIGNAKFEEIEPSSLIGYPIIIDFVMNTGSTLADAAMAVRSSREKAHTGRAVSVAAFINTMGDQLVPQIEQLRASGKFGKLQSTKISSILGYDYRNQTSINLLRGSESGVRAQGSRVQEILGRARAGVEGDARDNRRGAGSFSVGEVNGLTHVVAAPRGTQKQGSAVYPNAGKEVGAYHFSVGALRRIEIRKLFEKHRPDIEPIDVAAYIEEIDKYNNPKKEKLAIHWLITGAIEIPQDNYKLDRAIKTSERAKIDPFKYENPEEIFEKFAEFIPPEKRIDPDTVPELKNKVVLTNGITVYDVDETPVLTPGALVMKNGGVSDSVIASIEASGRDLHEPAGIRPMRAIMNSHWGKDSSPWCLLYGNENGELQPQAFAAWKNYSGLPKRVAFRNGKLLSFMGTNGNSEQWWDHRDTDFSGIPIEGAIQGDELGRIGTQEIDSKTGEATIVGPLWRGSKKNGVYEEWDALGLLRRRAEYRNGELDGVDINWDTTGAVVSYVNPKGLMGQWGHDGDPIHVVRFDEDGDVVGSEKRYYKGAIVSVCDYKHGNRNTPRIDARRYLPTSSTPYYYREEMEGGRFVSYRREDRGGERFTFWRENGAKVEASIFEDGIVQQVIVGGGGDHASEKRYDHGTDTHGHTLDEVSKMDPEYASLPGELEKLRTDIFARANELFERENAIPEPPPKIEAKPGLKHEEVLFSVAPIGGREEGGDGLYEAVSTAVGVEEDRPMFSVANRRFGWDDYPSLGDRVIHSTSHVHMVGHDDPYLHKKYEHFKDMKRQDPEVARLYAEDMARTIWARERYLGKYLLGKHFGYDEEALEAVRHLYQPKNMQQLQALVGSDRPTRWVYVHNTDGLNTNKIPFAFAKLLSDRFGGEVEHRIMKKSDERNTGADMQARAGRNFEWYGDPELEGNPRVIIVDDVWTTGSTTVSLLEYLKDKGADVHGIVTVAAASNSDRIRPSDADWTKFLKKSKLSSLDEASRIVGFDVHKLTGSEVYAYGVKGAKGRGGLAKWFERAYGLFEIPGGLFSDPGANGRDTEAAPRFAPTVKPIGKPRQQLLFSTAFPRIDRLGDDDLIVSALASGMLVNPTEVKGIGRKTAYGFFRKHRRETEELVRRAHPEYANDYAKVTNQAHMLMMRAQMLARDMKKDLEAGVEQSEILKRIPKKLQATYRGELAGQRKAGGQTMGYGMKAKQELENRWQKKVEGAVKVEVGIEPDLFEQWTGTDFTETLLQALMNPREKREDEQKPKAEPLTDLEQAINAASAATEVGTEQTPLKVEEIEEPRLFAEYLLKEMEKYWRVTKDIGQNPSINVWSDAVAFQFARKTAQNVFRKLVKSIVYSGARETAVRNIAKFAYAPTPAALVGQMTFVGEIIHARHIRETKQQMLEDLDKFLKTDLGAQGRFKPDKEELRRKVSAELELRARYMRHAMWLTDDAAKEEAAELVKEANLLIGTFSEADRDVEQSRKYRENQRKQSILREFGALRYKTLGEIEDAVNYWHEAAEGSEEKILSDIRDREIRTVKAAEILAEAVVNPKRTERAEPGSAMSFDNYILGHMGFVSLLQDLTRYADGQSRQAADAIIQYVSREIQRAGDRARYEEATQSDEFVKAVEAIYRKSFRKVMEEMNARDERFLPFMGVRGGKRVKPTKARAMQLLVSLLQAKKPGDDYYENAVRHDRHRQAPQIAELLSVEDMNMLAWIGRWYEDNRQGLSDICKDLFGIGVYAENPSYFPVKMLVEKQGLEAVEGVGWTIFPKALTPRVKNERDFDTQADVFSLWMSRMQESAQWKAHAKLGLEMRGIFGRSALQEAIVSNHGAKANSLLLEFITDILSGNGNSDRTASGVEKAADWIRGWTALSALGGNVGVMLKQTTSIPAFGFEIGLRDTARHILTAFTPAGMEAMKAVWNSNQRMVRWNKGSSEAVSNALRSDDASLVKKLFQAAMITNKIGDAVPYLVVGQGIYRDKLGQGMSEEDAMADTWAIIERTQQSSRLENQPKLQRRVKLGKLLYQFLSTQQQYLQYEMRAVREVMARPGSESARKLARTFALNHFILTSLYYWMGQLYSMMLGSEPPEDQLKDWMIANLLGPFGSLFVLGFCTKATLERALKGKQYGKGADMIPMEGYIKNQVGDAADLLEAIFSSEKDWDDVIEEAAQWANDVNATVRDLRKIDKNYLRPERYRKRTRYPAFIR